MDVEETEEKTELAEAIERLQATEITFERNPDLNSEEEAEQDHPDVNPQTSTPRFDPSAHPQHHLSVDGILTLGAQGAKRTVTEADFSSSSESP